MFTSCLQVQHLSLASSLKKFMAIHSVFAETFQSETEYFNMLVALE